MRTIRAALMMAGGCGVILLAGLAGPALGQGAVEVTTLFRGDTTSAGQAIVLPEGAVQVTVSQYVIAPGARLPVHRHPFERYAYVQGGRLTVTNEQTGAAVTYKTGDVIVEMVDTWHSAANEGDDPVRLLVIDQAPPGRGTTELKR